MNPSIGRICWVNMPVRSDQLCAAIVTYIHSETLVNVACFDRNGDIHPLMRMEFYHGDDGKVPVGQAGWMPYQAQRQTQPQVSVEEFEIMKEQIRNLTSLFQQLQDSAQPKPQIIPQAATQASGKSTIASATPAKS